MIRWTVNSPAASVRPKVKNKNDDNKEKVLKTSKTDLNTSWKVAPHHIKSTIYWLDRFTLQDWRKTAAPTGPSID